MMLKAATGCLLCLLTTMASAENFPPNTIIHEAKYRDAVATLIQVEGYECPHLSMLVMLGESAYGPKLEALCNTDGDPTNFSPELNYAIYPHQLRVTVCKPWGVFDNGCGD